MAAQGGMVDGTAVAYAATFRIGEDGRLTGKARHQPRSQPAISLQIRRLEDLVRAPLLTQEGRETPAPAERATAPIPAPAPAAPPAPAGPAP